MIVLTSGPSKFGFQDKGVEFNFIYFYICSHEIITFIVLIK